MINKISKILLLGGFFFTFNVQSEIILSDKMVFKISRSVFSLNDLNELHNDIETLKCIYPESLIIAIFQNTFLKSQRSHLKMKQKFTQKDKAYFLKLISFAKLFVYSKSQSVVIDPNIQKFFYLMGQRNKCYMNVFNEKNFNPRFKSLVELEVFVRSRFLPTERSGKTTKNDIKKAVLAAKSLIKSISRQIEEEVYW